MAAHKIAHATLKGPSVVKEICIGLTLGLFAGGLWKMHHWNEQRKTRAFYDMLEKVAKEAAEAAAEKTPLVLATDCCSHVNASSAACGPAEPAALAAGRESGKPRSALAATAHWVLEL
ncbi:cytochrome c oxidase [Musa troglodytarum]|uniref:Cytochrome c oxidase n=1 Tax=Musa troglodytarum TaxID=320322 RepID=A0A9E7EX91_9LILI|nr:cytochrome c oxidase [Musa troglodytarum]